MKSVTKMIILLTTICLIMASPLPLSAQQQAGGQIGEPGFAVLELFTSEGCSSCPPAEELLEQIDNAAINKPIYALAFHVDYWDRQGWKDTFSDHRYSNRQYQYSHLFSGQVYTPQLIINGKWEGIGSDRSYVTDGIRKALSSSTGSTLSIGVKQTGSNAVLHYQIEGGKKSAELVVAVVQKHAISHVLRGENKGRTLSHSGIVRGLEHFSIDPHKEGNILFSLPKGFNKEGWDIVSFLQDPKTGQISAADRASIR